MKKLSIIILSLVLLFCFVSCEKDKSEEMIANYEAFWKAYKVCNETYYALPKKTTNMSADTDVDYYDIQNILTAVDEENSNVEVISSSLEKSGSVTATKEGDKETYTYDIKIDYKYIKGGTGSVTQEGTLTISGTYEETETTSKTMSYNSDVKCKITINDTTYEITYYKDYTKTDVFTSATVNGNTVELRLLNAPYKY
jgi:hypothetical protein